MARGMTVTDAAQTAHITEMTYYRWRKRYDGMSAYQVAWLMRLLDTNARLRRRPKREASMSQPDELRINQVQLYRPRCSKCGGPTQLARIEPCDDPDHDERTFACVVCVNTDKVKVKFRVAAALVGGFVTAGRANAAASSSVKRAPVPPPWFL